VNHFLAQIIVWLNGLMNIIGQVLLGPVCQLPGWLSNTIISAVAGVALLLLFKVTSNQLAIGRVRDRIKANVLAMKLFKDSLSVTWSAQIQLYKGAVLLLFYALKPMLVMIVPVSLLLGQMSLWYQARPLLPAEETIVTMALHGQSGDPWPEVNIVSMPTAEVMLGPVRVSSKREIHWKIKAVKPGDAPIVFGVNELEIKKHLAIGEGWMQVSPLRPGWKWADILLYPLEKPFDSDSPIHSIRIDYPDRLSKVSGTKSWLLYFFVASMLFALLGKPILKVKT
jgi:hypothetical protein